MLRVSLLFLAMFSVASIIFISFIFCRRFSWRFLNDFWTANVDVDEGFQSWVGMETSSSTLTTLIIFYQQKSAFFSLSLFSFALQQTASYSNKKTRRCIKGRSSLNIIANIKSSHTFLFLRFFTTISWELAFLSASRAISWFLSFFFSSFTFAAYFFFKSSAQESQFAFNIGAVRMWKYFRKKNHKKEFQELFFISFVFNGF